MPPPPLRGSGGAEGNRARPCLARAGSSPVAPVPVFFSPLQPFFPPLSPSAHCALGSMLHDAHCLMSTHVPHLPPQNPTVRMKGSAAGRPYTFAERQGLAARGYDVEAAESPFPCYYSRAPAPLAHQCRWCQLSSMEACDFCMPCRGPHGGMVRHCCCACDDCGPPEDLGVALAEERAAHQAEVAAHQAQVAADAVT